MSSSTNEFGGNPAIISDDRQLTTGVHMNLINDYVRYETRRQFLSRGSNAVSWAALAALLGRDGLPLRLRR